MSIFEQAMMWCIAAAFVFFIAAIYYGLTWFAKKDFNKKKSLLFCLKISGLALVGGFVFSAIHVFSSGEVSKQSVVTEVASEKKSQASLVEDFEKKLSATEAPALSAIDVATKELTRVDNNPAALLSAYSSVCTARDACSAAMVNISHIEIPDGLASDTEKALSETRDAMQTSFYQRKKAYAALVEFIDERKPKFFKEFQDQAEASQLSILQAGASIVIARNLAKHK